MRIYLIGFMGCGKTTLGKKLALNLGYEFVDLDKKIEAETGITIAQYFEQFGEDEFRKMERNVLKNTGSLETTVIATGGGAPCFFDNITWMNENGTTVYISLPPKALVKRLENGIDERPVLQGLRGPELEAFIAEKLLIREPFYNQATLIANGMDLTAGKLSTLLAKHYRK